MEGMSTKGSGDTEGVPHISTPSRRNESLHEDTTEPASSCARCQVMTMPRTLTRRRSVQIFPDEADQLGVPVRLLNETGKTQKVEVVLDLVLAVPG